MTDHQPRELLRETTGRNILFTRMDLWQIAQFKYRLGVTRRGFRCAFESPERLRIWSESGSARLAPFERLPIQCSRRYPSPIGWTTARGRHVSSHTVAAAAPPYEQPMNGDSRQVVSCSRRLLGLAIAYDVIIFPTKTHGQVTLSLIVRNMQCISILSLTGLLIHDELLINRRKVGKEGSEQLDQVGGVL